VTEPKWLEAARADLGLAEIPGKATAPKITRWLVQLGAWWNDDETPWCGVAMDAWMRAAGVAPPRAAYRARSWLKWGFPIPHSDPVVGAIAVLERGAGGHVTIVAGRDRHGFLMGLGGNQGNRVSIAPFNPARVLGLRWPFEHLSSYYLQSTQLPLVAATATTGGNEA
jgi:uncharacterized protein (TIGR02594 family)